MKKVNEAYNNSSNSGKKKRYVGVFVKRTTKQQTDPQAPSSELIQITFKNLDKVDAQQIVDTVIPGAKLFMADSKSKTGSTFKVPAITFTVPDAKFAKWLRVVLPKIQTVFENSNSSEYPQAQEFEQMVIDAVHDAPSELTANRAQQSLKDLENAIYKAISENRWDDAMVIYKKAINLMAREYGHQLSPNNVKSIYAQAEAAGISPSDKGAETNSYWPDGTEKFWPTFVRSAKAWRSEFGRTIKDEPKMQYAMSSVFSKNADSATIDKRLKSQGFNSLSDASLQQREKLKNGGVTGGIRGVGYDISDTEGPNDFFLAPGLLNNLDGTLTDSAIADKEAWLKKIQDLKDQNNQVQMSDDDKRKEKAASEEGQAEIFMEAIQKLIETPKYEGGWQDLNITIQNGPDPITTYLLTVQDIATKKLEISGWNNKVNVTKIAQMVTAAVALSTVGKNKVGSLGCDFSNVGSVFNSFEQCKSTVIGVSDQILSALHKMTSKNDDKLNENSVKRFFTLLERIENRYNDGYNFELNEGLIHRPSDDAIMNFLGDLGLNLSSDDSMNMEDNQEMM